MTALQIYLADLTHVGNGIATEAFPLNIGLIASYAKKQFGDQVDIQLFKYPGDLKAAIQEKQPHILGCSNYTWNSNLSYYFCSLVKSLDPNVITVYGGTNYPFDPAPQQKFLEARPDLDFHIYYEGERAFAGLMERVLGSASRQEVFGSPIDSCQFIDRHTGALISGPTLPRIQNLDDIPSPYVTGLLDKFFDGNLTPLVETTRGCPFTCNFCNAYHSYFNKVNKFSDGYVQDELAYIAAKGAKLGVGHITFADNNFGMIPRDFKTAQYLSALQSKYGWPSSITFWTGKNAKERVIDVTKILGNTVSISMSVQSMDSTVLKNVGRDNIKLDHFQAIAEHLNAEGRPQHAEVIVPLPGETIQTHIDGLNKLLDTGVTQVMSHTLQILHGTPYKDDENYQKSHGYVTKHRIVPLDFSQIDGKYIFDMEEVGVATDSMSFDEYLESRKYLLVIDLCYSSGVFDPLKKYLATKGIANSSWIRSIFEQLDDSPPEITEIIDSFLDETRSELWDSEEELVQHYSSPEGFQKLIDYESGGNVLFKHRVWMLSKQCQQWIKSVFSRTLALILDSADADEEASIRSELEGLKNYVLCSAVDSLSPNQLEQAVENKFSYDLLAWLEEPISAKLGEYAVEKELSLSFHFSENTPAAMRSGFQTYGSDLAGLIKLVQRKSGISFTRDLVHAGKPDGAPSRDGAHQVNYGPGKTSM